MIRILVLTLLAIGSLGWNAHADAGVARVAFVLGDVRLVQADGSFVALKQGVDLAADAKVAMGEESVCEIALDDGNAYLRLDAPGEFTMAELFEDDGQNHAKLDTVTRLNNKWRKMAPSLPKVPSVLTLTGIRGGIVRPGVAKLQPGLEKSTFKEPFFIMNAKGAAAAIWHSQYFGDQEISFAKIANDQIPRISRLTRATGDSCWPCLAGDPDGTMYAAWEDGRDRQKKEIYFKKTVDGGATWSDAVRMTRHGQGAYDPVLWTQDETVILLWEDGRKGIYAVTSMDGGETWSDETRLVNGDAQWPQIHGTKENLWMVWLEKAQDNGVVKAMTSQDGGNTWGKPEVVAKSGRALGEPSVLALLEKGAIVAWRENSEDSSSIYCRTTLDGKAWSEAMRVSREASYHEYPCLFSTQTGVGLLHYGPTYDWNYAWISQSEDQGMTWSEAVRVPGMTNNVEKAFFVPDFTIPWDRSIYTNVDMTFKINQKAIGKIQNTLPEGQCIFEFDPRLLEYASYGQAKNRVEFLTQKMNGGDYHINNGFKIVQSVTQQEMMVVAASQEEADRIADALLPGQVNHALPDVGVFANKISGLPEERDKVGAISMNVEVFNIGAKTARNISVYIAKGGNGEGSVLSGKKLIAELKSGESRKVVLEFHNDGTFYQAAVVCSTIDKDSDPANNQWMFRMGYAKQGQLQVLAETGKEIIVNKQSTGGEVARCQSGEKIDLPIGVYKIAIVGETSAERENVAIIGGETTTVTFLTKGELWIKAPENYPVKIYRKEALVQEALANQTIPLEKGFYQVVVRCDGGEEARFSDVLIETGSQTLIPVKMGYIGVESLGNQRAKLLYPDGSFFREIPGGEYVQVPAGLYQVRVKPDEYEERDLGSAQVEENSHVKLRLTGFGQVGVTSAGQWDYTLFYANGDKFREISGKEIFCTIVPVGTYLVKVKPKDYDVIDMGRIVVKEGDVVKLRTPGFGKFGVESPGNWDYSLFYPDGRKFKDIKGSEMYLTVVPSGKYTAKVYPQEGEAIDLGEITIGDNQSVKKKVQGFGWVGVVSLGKWDAELLNMDGTRFRTIKGDQYKYTIIPEGKYRVVVKPDPYPEKAMGSIVVESYKKTTIHVDGFGQVGIESIGNWGSELYTLQGEKVCDLSPKDIYLKIVPAGKYRAKLQPDPYPERDLGVIEVVDKKPTRIKVDGYGWAVLSPQGNYKAELVSRAGGHVIEMKANAVQYTVVPVGEYVVKIDGKQISQVTVKEKEKLKIETGYDEKNNSD